MLEDLEKQVLKIYETCVGENQVSPLSRRIPGVLSFMNYFFVVSGVSRFSKYSANCVCKSQNSLMCRGWGEIYELEPRNQNLKVS
jgi:hypothetical protein